jgi:hypothetical protein
MTTSDNLFRIVALIPDSAVGLLLRMIPGLLGHVESCDMLDAQPQRSSQQQPPQPRSKPKAKTKGIGRGNGKPLSGAPAQVITSLEVNGPLSRTELINTVTRHDFSKGSVVQAVLALIRKHKIRVNSNNDYELVEENKNAA